MAASYPTVACMYASWFGSARTMRNDLMSQAKRERSPDQRAWLIAKAREWHRDSRKYHQKMPAEAARLARGEGA